MTTSGKKEQQDDDSGFCGRTDDAFPFAGLETHQPAPCLVTHEKRPGAGTNVPVKGLHAERNTEDACFECTPFGCRASSQDYPQCLEKDYMASVGTWILSVDSCPPRLDEQRTPPGSDCRWHYNYSTRKEF